MSEREYYVAVQRRGTVALPAELRRNYHLDEPGAQVRISVHEDGHIELAPLAAVPAGQRWFWTEEWQRREAEADADIAAGRTSVADSVDDLFNDLDS